MNSVHPKKKVFFLKFALGSLIVTSVGTGNAEAAWSGARCKTQCSKTVVRSNTNKLNECAKNCDNTKIMDILLHNADKLNADNQKRFQTALQDQHSIIEKQLNAETFKKKQSRSKIKDLMEKQDKLIAEIDRLKNLENKPEETSKTSELPKNKSGFSRATPTTPSSEASSRPQISSHRNKRDVNQPPSDLPPPYIPPPSDMPPTIEEHQAASKGHTEQKKGNVPSAPILGQNPRAILKAEIQAQNPGKKPFEIDALLKQHLESQYPGKSAAEINQALKDDQEARHPGKSHAEILDSLKAGGAQHSSNNLTAASSTVTNTSPQAHSKGATAKSEGANLMQALSGLGDDPMARLKKVDPDAEKKRLAAAEEKLKNNPNANKPGDMFSELNAAMAKRNSAMNPDKHNPETDFEQDWND